MTTNKKIPPSDDGWNSHRLWVVECLKQLSDGLEKCEKKSNDQQLEFVINVYKIKEDFQVQLKELADTILKLQIRVGLICAGLTIFISILANVIIRTLINGINE